jgi:hypothetical protein
MEVKVGAFNVLSQGVSNCGTGLGTLQSENTDLTPKLIFKGLNIFARLLETGEQLADAKEFIETHDLGTWAKLKKVPIFGNNLQYAIDELSKDSMFKIIADSIAKDPNSIPTVSIGPTMKEIHGTILGLSLYGGFELGSYPLDNATALDQLKGTEEFQVKYFNAKRRFIENEFEKFFGEGDATKKILVCTEFDYPIVTEGNNATTCEGKSLETNGRKVLACVENDLTVKVENNTYVPHDTNKNGETFKTKEPQESAIHENECIKLPPGLNLKYIRVGNKMQSKGSQQRDRMDILDKEKIDEATQLLHQAQTKTASTLEEQTAITAELKDANKALKDANEAKGKKFTNIFEDGLENKILQASLGSPMLNLNGNLGRVIIHNFPKNPIDMLNDDSWKAKKDPQIILNAVENLMGVKISLIVDLLLFEDDLVIVAVHLDSTTSFDIKKETESVYLLELVNALEANGFKVIVSGDFNFPLKPNAKEGVPFFPYGFDQKKIGNVTTTNWDALVTGLNLYDPRQNPIVGVALKKRFDNTIGNDQYWEGKSEERSYDTDFVGVGPLTLENKISKAEPLKQQYHKHNDQKKIFHPYIHFDANGGIVWPESHLSDHILVHRTFTFSTALAGGARKLKRSKNRRKKGSKKSKKNRRNRRNRK